MVVVWRCLDDGRLWVEEVDLDYVQEGWLQLGSG
jgi:hypothetical protein